MVDGPVPDIALSTLERVRELLAASAVPLSRNALLEALAQGGHSTTRRRLNRALAFLFDVGLAVEDRRGISWARASDGGPAGCGLLELANLSMEDNGCGPPTEWMEVLRAELDAVESVQRATKRGAHAEPRSDLQGSRL